MKIVIDIPKNQYTTLNAKTQDDIVEIIDHGALIKAIKNGTPLPEGQYDCRTIDRMLEIIDGLNNMEKAKGYEELNEGFDDAIKLIMDEVLALKGEQE